MTRNTQHCVYDAVQNQLIALVRLKSRREKRRAQGGHYPIPGPAENLRIGWICQPLLLVGILMLFQLDGGGDWLCSQQRRIPIWFENVRPALYPGRIQKSPGIWRLTPSKVHEKTPALCILCLTFTYLGTNLTTKSRGIEKVVFHLYQGVTWYVTD